MVVGRRTFQEADLFDFYFTIAIIEQCGTYNLEERKNRRLTDVPKLKRSKQNKKTIDSNAVDRSNSFGREASAD